MEKELKYIFKRLNRIVCLDAIIFLKVFSGEN